MKRIMLLPFVIGLVAVPLQAQAQQSTPLYPLQYNGLFFDPPVAQDFTPHHTERSYAPRRLEHQPRAATPSYPSYGPGPSTFDANAPR